MCRYNKSIKQIKANGTEPFASACRKSRNKKLIIVNFYDIAKPSLEEIPLLGEMSRSDKRVAVFAEKGVTANAVTEGWKVR